MLKRNLTSDKSNVDAFLLCSLFGMFGFHRLYVGKYFTALLQFFTLGGLLVWTLIDWIAIIREDFTDFQDHFLTWEKDKEGQYASLKVRLSAHIIDTALITAGCFLVFYVILMPMSSYLNNQFFLLFYEVEDFIRIMMSILYYVILTASKRQATVGKNIIGVIVVDRQKQPLSMMHSLGRCLSYYFSYLTLGIGFLMIAWTKKHTGLHDKIAQTYVIYGKR